MNTSFCTLFHQPHDMHIYIMAGRAFVVVNEVFYHQNGNGVKRVPAALLPR